jgi:hypothetical protein
VTKCSRHFERSVEAGICEERKRSGLRGRDIKKRETERERERTESGKAGRGTLHCRYELSNVVSQQVLLGRQIMSFRSHPHEPNSYMKSIVAKGSDIQIQS